MCACVYQGKKGKGADRSDEEGQQEDGGETQKKPPTKKERRRLESQEQRQRELEVNEMSILCVWCTLSYWWIKCSSLVVLILDCILLACCCLFLCAVEYRADTVCFSFARIRLTSAFLETNRRLLLLLLLRVAITTVVLYDIIVCLLAVVALHLRMRQSKIFASTPIVIFASKRRYWTVREG